ncbi:MAG: ion transporter [Gallionella sp.]
MVDLLSTLPSYIGLFLSGANYAMALRLFRLVRIFRVLKLAYYLEESAVMAHALAASRRKLMVFLLSVLTLVMILGYAIIAVPAGIVTVGMARSQAKQNVMIACPRCMLEGHAQDVKYCRQCGERLLDHGKPAAEVKLT